ncbi:MAG: GatB/YqeY domain-containing protein [Candidatus Pacebacteria bacterium]|nr:GatB/YqeY domain-containing protein [Candidatus Paceibacterota bacterium]
MSLRQRIKQDLIRALKQKEPGRVSILRFVLAEIKNLEIDQNRQELDDQDLIKVLNSQVKKLSESLELFTKGRRQDLIFQTQAEIKILKEYLPEQISDEELEKRVSEILAQNPAVTRPGAIIGLVIKQLGNQAEGSKVAQIVSRKITRLS